MKCTVIIDKHREPEILIYSHSRTPLVEEMEALASTPDNRLLGFKEKATQVLDPKEIYCFITENNKVFALTENEKYNVKQRLYELEKILSKDFIKINKSCIANIKKIKRFDASIYGSIKVVFKNEYEEYVSRRNIKSIKENQ